MRFSSFIVDGRESFGAVLDSGIVDLGRRQLKIRNLKHAIESIRLEELWEIALASSVDYAGSEVQFLSPIPNAGKIICIGVNYKNRNAEYKDGSKEAKYPSVFMRAKESLVGHKQFIVDPIESNQLDYEGEIVIVIGESGRRIPAEFAHRHIAGLTLMNEGSVRDWMRHSKFNVTQGKNFAKSGSSGPWLVTPESCDPLKTLKIKTRVNGETRQSDTTANLIFSFAYLIQYLSTFYELKAGDMIATGTPNGAGARLNPPKYLKSGDEVEVEVEEIGMLKNKIISEKEYSDSKPR